MTWHGSVSESEEQPKGSFHEYDVVSASRREVPVLAASVVLGDVVEWALVGRAWL